MMKKSFLTLAAGFIMILGTYQTVYAEEAAGPASDRAAILEAAQEAEGPAAYFLEEGDSTQSSSEQQEEEKDSLTEGGRVLDPAQPMVALTFDDGPFGRVGNRIMDTLERYQGRATFFVVGSRIPGERDEILRMKQNGHEVANHTQDHRYLTGLSAAQIRAQIDSCSQAVAAVTGEAPALMRVPGGYYNNRVLANSPLPVIMWTIDTKDWKTRNAESTVQVILNQVQDGDIILMHELYGSTADAVDAVAPVLAERGYQMVTVSELAAFRGGVSAGRVYSKFRR